MHLVSYERYAHIYRQIGKAKSNIEWTAYLTLACPERP